MPTDDLDRPTPPMSVDGLLSRHQSVVMEGLDEHRRTLVRRSEVLVARSDLARFRSAVRDGYVEEVRDVTADVVRVRIPRGVDASVLSAEVADRSGGELSVTPNHLMYACLPPEDTESDPARPGDDAEDRRGEWWGGRPPGTPVGAMEAQGGGDGPPGTDGEWWGGPVDQPWPVDPFGPPTSDPSTGRVATVAVLDTGIVGHPWWDGTDWFHRVATDDAEDLDLYPADNRRDRQAGHGTFVAGVVVQTAPTARLVVERVLRSDGLCDEAELLAVLSRIGSWLSRADGQGIDVVNMSFGGYTYDDKPSPHIAAAVAALTSRMAVVAAAGNHGSERKFWPAALPDVVAVGALNASGDIAQFSNRGEWVDTYRLGVRLQSSFISFPGSPPEPVTPSGSEPARPPEPAFDGYARWSGTSFAAPVVTAEIAQLTAQGMAPSDAATFVRTGGGG